MMVKNQLKTSAQYLKGVGPKVAKLLSKLGVQTIEDLLYFFPREYEDRRHPIRIRDLKSQEQVIIRGEVLKVIPRRTRNRFSILTLAMADATGMVDAVFFNQPFLQRMFRPGMKLILSGKVEINLFKGGMQLKVKDWEIDTGVPLGIIPIYPLTEGLYPKGIRKITHRALDEHLSQLEDTLPNQIRDRFKLMGLIDAIEALHYPKDPKTVEAARYRIVFDDLFTFQLGWGLRRAKIKKEKGISFKIDDVMAEQFIGDLPFKLTKAQQRVIEEIEMDLVCEYPMNRLLQGDVGSGKTVVSALAAYIVIKNGYQTALLAPTEILAQQHYEKMQKYLKKQGVKVGLLTGTTQKKQKTYDLSKYDLVVGTHAMIEEKVRFSKLGLAIIDEQHRFGVLQRSALTNKGVFPDMLFMTATPIPRSLALTLYGDLERSVIDEMPAGRKPVKTFYVPEKKRQDSYKFMRKQVKDGRQIFIVYPLVEESAEMDLKAAKEEALKLQNTIFPDLKVGLIHGRMKGAEKEGIMQDFKKKKINILVSTTVIEVGIDVPNASVMVIEHAERFGLSQLHQLRGRIGRGSAESFCFLVGAPKTKEAVIRLKAMLKTTDGFKIAEEDLKLRGPGDFYGARQSGLPEFRLADIIKDEKVLLLTRQAANDLLEHDPALERYPELVQQIQGRYGRFLGY